ncbi:hypothetical protein [Marinilabilia sp.]|uniref:hypothetical protein n=1 Tax=Marinilabilia sp. TaxID=2021252 RepID=UPI0025C69360|nr:hypothetical protein [Marinilabilia sp.]
MELFLDAIGEKILELKWLGIKPQKFLVWNGGSTILCIPDVSVTAQEEDNSMLTNTIDQKNMNGIGDTFTASVALAVIYLQVVVCI